MVFHANRIQKQAGVAILICNKAVFRPKLIIKDKEVH
jgi:hypothetical protein